MTGISENTLRSEISKNPNLTKYRLTIVQSLNDEAFRAMAVSNGLKMEEGATTKALDVASTFAGIAIPIPIANQLAQLALSGAYYVAAQIEKNNNSEKARKFLAINPEHDSVEWKNFVDKLATKLTIQSKDKIENCKDTANNDDLVSKLKDFFGTRPHKNEQDQKSLAIKALALRDSTKIIETVLNEKNLVGDVGIEDSEVKNKLIDHLVDVISNTPSSQTKATQSSRMVTGISQLPSH